MKDFYLPDHAVQSYLEKDWYDHVLKSGLVPRLEYAPFDVSLLYSDYHERAVEFLKGELGKIAMEPVNVLEVGSSLGRGYYEVATRLRSVRQATLVEPSINLYTLFNSIFLGPRVAMPEGLDTSAIRRAVERVDLKVLNLPFAEMPQSLGEYDLVICSNVIDQCTDPLKLVERLKSSTRKGGVVLLSCTYQWQQKYLGNASPRLANINSLFNDGFCLLGETNIPFRVRAFERHWLSFLSHVGIYRREQ